ncbi:MAG: TIGR04282 family arsenosugar biosynthesis glycosyltransferase [Flavobacteriales bacterium]
MTDRVLIVTARYPVLGEVKSRLANVIGSEAALKVYLTLLDRCAAVLANLQAKKYIFFTGTDAPQTRLYFQSLGCHIAEQSDGDIGQRMHHAFTTVWEANPKAKLVLVGTDVPDLTAGIVEAAFNALNTHNAVLGPAIDGGYYLIGLSAPEPEVFTGIAWSTETVCATTIDILQQKGKRVALVDELHDIDYLADLQASIHFPEYPSEQ